MFRYLFAFLLLLHGVIHLMGYANQWHPTAESTLPGKTVIPLSAGVSALLARVWLVTAIGFGLAFIGFLFRREGWMALTLACLIVSQLLIVLYWPEAKAGTWVNLLIGALLYIAYANDRFEKMADQEAKQVIGQPITDHRLVTEADLSPLPDPVRQWLRASGVVGKERVHRVRLRQKGFMRTSPDGKWMPTEAEQYVNVDQPGFIWKADVAMFPFFHFAGRDRYANGKGNMLIKAMGVVPVVDAADAKIDQGTLLRFLGELCWYPSAALNPYLTWIPLDNHRAKATMTYRGVTASAVFAFDDQHRLVSVTANRYKGGGADGQLTEWYIPTRAWKPMHDVTIPTQGDGIWHLPTGDFNYYRWEITDIDYNVPALYP